MPPTAPRRINHVIVLMLENRSFDHLFGFFKAAAGQQLARLTGQEFNLFDPSKPPSTTNRRMSRRRSRCGTRKDHHTLSMRSAFRSATTKQVHQPRIP